MSLSATQKNVERFSGFADTYDSSRPAMPEFPAEIIERYFGRKLSVVIDLGCGTGLSSLIWQNRADKVIGIEPSDDMRAVAEKKASGVLTFIKGYSDNMPVDDERADAVVCSQSFHWMEPVATLKEVSRVLKKGGVFATVDCDWPPVSNWSIDKKYSELDKKVKRIEKENPTIKDSFKRYDKIHHLENIENSGHFRFAREIVFSNREDCTAERLINLALSQGGAQTILKEKPSLIEDDIKAFEEAVYETFGDKTFPIDFSYRMRIAVK